MHEVSLCEGILQIIEEQSNTQSFTKVKSVILEIGPLAGVEISAMEFGFEVVKKGTIAEEATLQIIQTEAEAWCIPCGKRITITERASPCPECGSHQLQLLSGEQLRIKELEVV